MANLSFERDVCYASASHTPLKLVVGCINMNDSHQNDDSARIDLHSLVDAAKKKAENQILRAYFNSVFEMSPLVDKFATWLLAGVGATAALTITNIKSITSIIPFENIKIGIGLLVISGLFGFLEKFLALDIQSTVSQESKLRDILRESSDEFKQQMQKYEIIAGIENIDIRSEVNIAKVLDEFAEAHPWYKKIQIGGKTVEDSQKARLRRYYRQLTYTVLEFVGFLLFIVIAVLSI